jgi:type IV secretory pathway VirB10-like protein
VFLRKTRKKVMLIQTALVFVIIAGALYALPPEVVFALEGEDAPTAPEPDAKPPLSWFKGGKAEIPKPPKQRKEDFQMPAMPAPAPLPPPPPPPPPPQMDSPAVDQAERDARRQSARQNGMARTLLAGETGGYKPGQPATDGKKTLLG